MTIPTSKSMSGLGASSSFIPPPPRRTSTTSLSSMVASRSVGGGGDSVSNSVFSTFPTPRKSNQKRTARDGQRRPPTRTAKNMRREYQILQSQKLLLVGTASLSFLLFLLFTLPFAALIGLTVMITSLGACLLVASAAVKTRYHLELEHPLGLVRYLPESLRAHLTEKSLHDCLSPSGSKDSLVSLTQSNSGSLSSMSQHNSSSKGSLSSITEKHHLDQGNRQRHKRNVRVG